MTKKRRRSVKAPPQFIAAALAAAELDADAVVARQFSIPVKVLQGWRARATHDPELIEVVAKARREAIERWRGEASVTYIAVVREIRRLVTAHLEVPFSLIAAAKTVGGTNIEAGALLGDERPPENGAKP